MLEKVFLDYKQKMEHWHMFSNLQYQQARDMQKLILDILKESKDCIGITSKTWN